MKTLIFLVASFLVTTAHAQTLFGDRCLGTWKGMMYIYQYGSLRDSVEVKFTVAKTSDPNAWTWKTEYLSIKMPVVKDYVLRLKDKGKNQYVTDEGGGLELTDYLTGNKLYCVFETQSIMLTSTYELRGDELIFEVTSGKKETVSHPEVINYSTTSVQRVIFKRAK
jgi:hypothetical protein